MLENLLRELEAEYAQKRLQNERTELRRRETILKGHPDIAVLMHQRESLIHETLQGIIAGHADAEALPEKMERISAQIREALTKAGFPDNYLSPVVQCTLCNDSGYVGDPVRKPCECFRRAYRKKLRAQFGIQRGSEAEETFETFRLDIFPDDPLPGSTISQRNLMQTVRSVCENWADQYPDVRYRDILLTGQSGLGKTFLLRAMADRLIRRDMDVLLINAFQFFQSARKSYYENDSYISGLDSVPILMLDDLGSEPVMQNITIEQLFNLINSRQGRGLSTIISTNLDAREFRNRYTERIASRVMDLRKSQVISLSGKDIRRREA